MQADPERLIADLVARIRSRQCTVAVIGLGYVGVPLALAACKAGFSVLGFDTDETRVAQVNRAEGFMSHIPQAALGAAIDSGRLSATSSFDRLEAADIIVIAVPTPLSRQREPDLSFVVASADAVARRLRRGQLIVLESTTWPGTTDEVMRPRLERSGLASGVDFFLAFSPERQDPGNADFSATSIPKVIGGDGSGALELARAFYDELIVRTVPVSSPKTAEAVKLTENIFRAVNIALVNELKIIYGKMGIDIWEVIEAAQTKPFGFMPFHPGPGLGGHCIPIDPFYLSWKAREFDTTTRLIELAGQINTSMPHYVVDRVAEALDRQAQMSLSRARVLLIGIAYKRNIDDMRESPALRLMALLEGRGATTDYHDPHVPVIPGDFGTLAGRRSVPLSGTTIAAYDLVLVVTDHDAVDYRALAAAAKIVVDTRNACARAGAGGSHIVKA